MKIFRSIFLYGLCVLILVSCTGLAQSSRDARVQPEKLMDAIGVKPGMILRMNGARGHGIRRVMSIDDDKIVAQKVKLVWNGEETRWTGYDLTYILTFDENGSVGLDNFITTHMLDKVKSVITPISCGGRYTEKTVKSMLEDSNDI